MQRIIDITGNKYNRLTVLGLDHIYTKNGKTRTCWRCRCDCGNETVIRKDEFIYPYSKVKSCGCWHKEESSTRPKNKKDGKYVKIIRGVNYGTDM